MQIQVNTDNKVDAPERIAENVRVVIEKALKKVGGRVTRVEVHLTQESASGPDDVKCVMEARMERHQPTAVSHHAPTVHLAVEACADKLGRALSSVIDRLRDHR